MFSDRVMHLADAGVINGRRKSLLPGKIVTEAAPATVWSALASPTSPGATPS